MRTPRPALRDVDLEGLFCALVLVPTSFSRNRFFGLFEGAPARRVRRRAARIRGVLRQLTAPEPSRAEILGEQVLADGRLILRYRVEDFAFVRTVALSPLEAATLRVALHRAIDAPLTEEDRLTVEGALSRLAPELQPVSLR